MIYYVGFADTLQSIRIQMQTRTSASTLNYTPNSRVAHVLAVICCDQLFRHVAGVRGVQPVPSDVAQHRCRCQPFDRVQRNRVGGSELSHLMRYALRCDPLPNHRAAQVGPAQRAASRCSQDVDVWRFNPLVCDLVPRPAGAMTSSDEPR